MLTVTPRVVCLGLGKGEKGEGVCLWLYLSWRCVSVTVPVVEVWSGERGEGVCLWLYLSWKYGVGREGKVCVCDYLSWRYGVGRCVSVREGCVCDYLSWSTCVCVCLWLYLSWRWSGERGEGVCLWLYLLWRYGVGREGKVCDCTCRGGMEWAERGRCVSVTTCRGGVCLWLYLLWRYGVGREGKVCVWHCTCRGGVCLWLYLSWKYGVGREGKLCQTLYLSWRCVSVTVPVVEVWSGERGEGVCLWLPVVEVWSGERGEGVCLWLYLSWRYGVGREGKVCVCDYLSWSGERGEGVCLWLYLSWRYGVGREGKVCVCDCTCRGGMEWAERVKTFVCVCGCLSEQSWCFIPCSYACSTRMSCLVLSNLAVFCSFIVWASVCMSVCGWGGVRMGVMCFSVVSVCEFVCLWFVWESVCVWLVYVCVWLPVYVSVIVQCLSDRCVCGGELDWKLYSVHIAPFGRNSCFPGLFDIFFNLQGLGIVGEWALLRVLLEYCASCASILVLLRRTKRLVVVV